MEFVCSDDSPFTLALNRPDQELIVPGQAIYFLKLIKKRKQ